MTSNDRLSPARRAMGAAQALWRSGHLPECHAFMLSSLRATLDAWLPSDAPLEPEAREQKALALLAEHEYPRIQALRGVLSALRSPRDAPPSAAPGAALPPDFERIWLEAERLLRFSEARLRPRADGRRRRVLLAGLLSASVIAALFLAYRLWGRVRVEASAVYSPAIPASYAVDDLENTEWLLPDAALGWIDLQFPHPRRLHDVVVLNGHNRAYLDRATRRFRLTAYDGHKVRATADGEFPSLTAARSALDVKLQAKHVTRLRLEVLSYFGSGSAVAEIQPH